jgi:hypothetical protein
MSSPARSTLVRQPCPGRGAYPMPRGPWPQPADPPHSGHPSAGARVGAGEAPARQAHPSGAPPWPGGGYGGPTAQPLAGPPPGWPATQQQLAPVQQPVWPRKNPSTAAHFTVSRPGRRPPRRHRRWLHLGALSAVMVAVVLVGGFAAPGWFVDTQLDVTAVETGVKQILTDPSGYGGRDVTDVTCNDGHNPTIKPGDSFRCEATINRVRQLFVVTFTDDSGGYTVNRS